MKIIDCIQRSPEWFATRNGIPTASGMANIITASWKPRVGKRRDAYMLQLLGERLTLTPAHTYETAAMARGRELEAFARAWYVEHTGRAVKEVGFVLADSGLFGCSPDGLCDNHGLEIKCPGLPAFLAYATTRDMPEDYYVQVQASMMICGLDSWDFLVYTDARGLVPVLTTVMANAKFQESLASTLGEFCAELDLLTASMTDAGNGLPAGTPIDLSALEQSTVDLEGIK